MSIARDEKGHFLPGHGATRTGRPNKAKKALEERILAIVEGNIAQVRRDLKGLDPKDRVRAITDLLKYVMPAKRAVDSTVNIESILEQSPEQVVDLVLQKLLEMRNE
jgi:hypothetical protein